MVELTSTFAVMSGRVVGVDQHVVLIHAGLGGADWFVAAQRRAGRSFTLALRATTFYLSNRVDQRPDACWDGKFAVAVGRHTRFRNPTTS
jgi:hypothetical protein